MLLNEDINLPGVNSHTDAIPGFIHYYNSSDGIFEEQVFVEVEGVFSIRQMPAEPNDTQPKTDHIPFKVDILVKSKSIRTPRNPNPRFGANRGARLPLKYHCCGRSL